MRRLTRLDGLRGVLAVYVMLGHAMPFTVLPGGFAAPFGHGEAAVELFFALSGLVIINSLEHYRDRFWPFLNARGWRLLPVYFVVLAFSVLVTQAGLPLAAMPWAAHSRAAHEMWSFSLPGQLSWHLAAHLALLQGLLPQGILPYAYISLLGPAWSLSTEWQFYLAMAALVPLLPAPSRLTVFAWILMGCGILYHILAPHLPPYWQFTRAFLPDAGAFFALGLASAVWLRGGGVRLLLACLAIAVALGLDTAEPAKALIPLSWGVIMLVQRFPRFPLLGTMLESRAAQYLGAVSYPLYLVNEPVQRACAMLIAPFCHGDAMIFSLVWLPAAMLVPVLAAAALHHGMEKPVMQWRRKREAAGHKKVLVSAFFL